jgi:hypothetical protein
MQSPGAPEELDSEQLLAQGDELLKSSRELLDQIGEIDLRDDDGGADSDAR